MNDAAGNMTTTPVRPGSGVDAGQNVGLTAVYDAYNHLMRGTAGSNEEQHYRYDPFGRRIAAMELSTTTIMKGRRYIYDGWMAVAERKFEAADSGTTTLEVGASKLERIYVTGPNIDEWLYAAIDFNSDGDIRDDLNSTECSWSGSVAGKDTADAAYYFLTNRMGSIAALLDKNSDRKVLEYYRYRTYGEVTVLTVLDDGTSPGTASDGIEDTPSDLGDNPTRRISKFANPLTFTGRRLDDATGVMYYRHRMYDPVSGRFVSRDPLEVPKHNLYGLVEEMVTVYIDPTGLQAEAKTEDVTDCFQIERVPQGRLVAGQCGAFKFRFYFKLTYVCKPSDASNELTLVQLVSKSLQKDPCSSKVASHGESEMFVEAWSLSKTRGETWEVTANSPQRATDFWGMQEMKNGFGKGTWGELSAWGFLSLYTNLDISDWQKSGSDTAKKEGAGKRPHKKWSKYGFPFPQFRNPLYGGYFLIKSKWNCCDGVCDSEVIHGESKGFGLHSGQGRD